MNVYIPLGLSAYGDAFKEVADVIGKTRASHTLCKIRGNQYFIPTSLNDGTLQPENFVDLLLTTKTKELWLIDRIKHFSDCKETVVQIVDHRNLTGRNPLIGKTPLQGKPQFPDVSNIYNRKDFGITQINVTVVGPDSFDSLTESVYGDCVSELVALVSVSAVYAGFQIYGIGWNQKSDPRGHELAEILTLANKKFYSKNY